MKTNLGNNHRSTTTPQARTSRFRKAVAALALSTAVAAPAAVLTAAPAGAIGCSSWYCGGSSNHNEAAAEDQS